jgi:glycosyltransferase involved in cell wall biosynthesis
MSKIIFVNDTAATEGGALTILKQFLDSIKLYSIKDYLYYVFCSVPELKVYENEQIKIVNDIKAKKWLERIKWDLWGLKNWSKKNNIKANLIISLQNTGYRYFKNTKQLIYINQALPFFQDKKWNILKRDERNPWFYQNIYKKIIKYSLNKDSIIIVQTETMKEKVINVFHWNPNKIFVIRPNCTNININQVSKIDFNDKKFHIFYPASTVLYKNHEVIIKALKYIKDNIPDVFKNLQVHFTFDNSTARNLKLIQLMNDLKVNNAIKLEGKLPYDKVLSFYKSCDLVIFPSYLESFPLPLIETALFGLPLLASDLEFSREIIGNYEGAQFIDYQNEKEWAEKIIEAYHQKKRFSPYFPSFNTNWQTFFELINKLLIKNYI